MCSKDQLLGGVSSNPVVQAPKFSVEALTVDFQRGQTDGPEKANLTADVLSQWQVHWDKQAASTDLRQAEIYQSQWKLVREQITSFSEELVTLCSELRAMRRDFDAERRKRDSSEEDSAAKIEQVKGELQVKYEESAEKIEQLRRDVLAEQEERAEDNAAACCSLQGLEARISAQMQALRSSLQQSERKHIEERDRAEERKRVEVKFCELQGSLAANDERVKELTERYDNVQSSTQSMESQLLVASQEVGKIATSLASFSERINAEFKEHQRELSKRIEEVADEVQCEKRERNEHFKALQDASTDVSSAGAKQHEKCCETTCSRTGTVTPPVSVSPGKVANTLWGSLDAGDEESIQAPSSIDALPSPSLPSQVSKRSRDEIVAMVKDSIQQELSSLGDALQRRSEHADETSAALSQLQGRLNLECKERARFAEMFTEQLNTLSEALHLEVSRQLEDARTTISEAAANLQQELANEKEGRTEQDSQLLIGLSNLGVDVMQKVTAIRQEMDEIAQARDDAEGSNKASLHDVENLSSLLRNELEAEQNTRMQDSQILLSRLQSLESQVATQISNLDGAVLALRENRSQRGRECDCIRIANEANQNDKSLREALWKEEQMRKEGHSQLATTVGELQKKFEADCIEKSREMAYLGERMKFLPDAVSLQINDRDEAVSHRLDEFSAKLRHELMSEREEQMLAAFEAQSNFVSRRDFKLMEDEFESEKALRAQDVERMSSIIQSLCARLDSECNLQALPVGAHCEDVVVCRSPLQETMAFKSMEAGVQDARKALRKCAENSAALCILEEKLSAEKEERIQCAADFSVQLTTLQHADSQKGPCRKSKRHLLSYLEPSSDDCRLMPAPARSVHEGSEDFENEEFLPSLTRTFQTQLEFESCERKQQDEHLASEVKALAQLIDLEVTRRAKSIDDVCDRLRHDLGVGFVSPPLEHPNLHRIVQQRCVPSDSCRLASPRNDHGHETVSMFKVQCMVEDEKCERTQAHVDILQRFETLSDSVKLIEGEGSNLRRNLLAFEARINEQIQAVRLSLEMEAAERGAGFEQIASAMTVHGHPVQKMKETRTTFGQVHHQVRYEYDERALALAQNDPVCARRTDGRAVSVNSCELAVAEQEARSREMCSEIADMKEYVTRQIEDQWAILDGGFQGRQCWNSGLAHKVQDEIHKGLHGTLAKLDSCQLMLAEQREEGSFTRCQVEDLKGSVSQQIKDLWAGLEVEAAERSSSGDRLEKRCNDLHKSLGAEVEQGLQAFMKLLDREAGPQLGRTHQHHHLKQSIDLFPRKTVL